MDRALRIPNVSACGQREATTAECADLFLGGRVNGARHICTVVAILGLAN